jgi:phosphoribosylformimino-5-aminoimidazole carboxamide ribotide isomerase
MIASRHNTPGIALLDKTRAMEVIPVLDLMDGSVVRARMGERAHYRPIATPLSPGSDPLDVARGLLRIGAFERFYVADLDAIAGKRGHRAVLRRLRSELDLELWVDGGIADLAAARDWLDAGLGYLVLGSETQTDPTLVRRLSGNPRVVLSLDFRGDDFLGPPALLAEPDAWPDCVIVMTLARVGSGAGPDFSRIAAIRALAGPRKLYAAGGIRGGADLADLARAGVAGSLVASCLHDGALNGPEIVALGGTRAHAGGSSSFPSPRLRGEGGEDQRSEPGEGLGRGEE